MKMQEDKMHTGPNTLFYFMRSIISVRPIRNRSRPNWIRQKF